MTEERYGDELLGANMAKIDELWDIEKLPERVVHLKENDSNVFEGIHIHKDGFVLPVEISAKVISYCYVRGSAGV